ncbi:MAG: diguanylate cyclase [Candidatus Bipolaricaulota bacterium]
MQWILTPEAGALYVTAGLSLVVFGLAWSRRSFAGGGPFAALFLAVAGYALVAGNEAGFVSLEWKIFWSKLEYAGSGATAALFLWFAARYAGRDRWLRGTRRVLLWIPAALAVAAVSTNELHGWVWPSFSPGPAGSNAVIYAHGPAFYLIVGQIYAYILVACAYLMAPALRPGTARRRQAGTVLLAALFPLVGGLLYVIAPPMLAGINLVPISFLLTGLVFLASLGFLRVFDLVPVARDRLMEQMPDAVLVLDARGRIADANAAALRLLRLDASSLGREARYAVASWDRLGLSCGKPADRHFEATLSQEPLVVADVRVTPLRDRGRPSGCLVVLRDITPRFLTEAELRIVNDRLGAQIRRVESLQEELREQAIRDGLTGLFNRRYLDEVLPRELERARHSGQSVSVIMIDLDHFKVVNDRRGHREGDRLLARLGALLRERTRAGDAACRYGGEEFLLVLPGTPTEVAAARAEEIRESFANLVLETRCGVPVTLSIGVASFPAHAETDDDLLQAVDRALYEAKHTGRDAVRVARPPAAPG